jgi:alkanesulfonate monooxygenase SsuD/methylene tetrahydromethanopterin reductase-like flavin-dependent oxidoreductase (luciferase family)
LAGSGALSIVRLRTGRPGPVPTPEEAAAYNFTPHEKEIVKAWTASHIVGDPEAVRDGIDDLVARTGADEIMIAGMAHDPAARRRSIELVAEAWGLEALR